MWKKNKYWNVSCKSKVCVADTNTSSSNWDELNYKPALRKRRLQIVFGYSFIHDAQFLQEPPPAPRLPVPFLTRPPRAARASTGGRGGPQDGRLKGTSPGAADRLAGRRWRLAATDPQSPRSLRAAALAGLAWAARPPAPHTGVGTGTGCLRGVPRAAVRVGSGGRQRTGTRSAARPPFLTVALRRGEGRGEKGAPLPC